jgi:hypothetical protein
MLIVLISIHFPKKNARSYRFCMGQDALKKMKKMTEKPLKPHRSFRCFPHTSLSKEHSCVRTTWLSRRSTPGYLGEALPVLPFFFNRATSNLQSICCRIKIDGASEFVGYHTSLRRAITIVPSSDDMSGIVPLTGFCYGAVFEGRVLTERKVLFDLNLFGFSSAYLGSPTGLVENACSKRGADVIK